MLFVEGTGSSFFSISEPEFEALQKKASDKGLHSSNISSFLVQIRVIAPALKPAKIAKAVSVQGAEFTPNSELCKFRPYQEI